MDLNKSKKWRWIFLSILCILFLIVVLIYNGVIITDHSAQEAVEGAVVTWKGNSYNYCSGEYHEGKRIAKTNEGSYLKEVEEDPTHTFIVIRSFLDQQLLVRDDYIIPTTGDVTAVFWNREKINNKDFCEAVMKIESVASTDFKYETDGIFQLKDGQQMRRLYFCYEDCPIGTDFKGYMGKVNDKWVITTKISDDQNNPDGSPKPYTVECYTIPSEYHEILDKYLT